MTKTTKTFVTFRQWSRKVLNKSMFSQFSLILSQFPPNDRSNPNNTDTKKSIQVFPKNLAMGEVME